MVREIISNAEIAELEKIYYLLFKNKDPFGSMFQDRIQDRLILFPFNDYSPEPDLYQALVRAIHFAGDNSFFQSEIEAPDCFLPLGKRKFTAHHWVYSLPVPFCELETPTVENAVFSPSGKWGLMVSHEDHAVLGGTLEFMAKFKELWPQWKDGMAFFATRYGHREWARTLLNHILNHD